MVWAALAGHFHFSVTLSLFGDEPPPLPRHRDPVSGRSPGLCRRGGRCGGLCSGSRPLAPARRSPRRAAWGGLATLSPAARSSSSLPFPHCGLSGVLIKVALLPATPNYFLCYFYCHLCLPGSRQAAAHLYKCK